MKNKTLFVAISVLLALSFLFGTALAEEDNVGYEAEPNDSTAEATLLGFNRITVGNLSDESDVDYYTFQTISTGDILFHVQPNTDGIYAFYWYAQVLDENLSVLKEGTLNGNGETEFSLKTAKPGTYYLRISAIKGGNPLTNGFTTDPYLITVSTICLMHSELKDWEYTIEPSCSQPGERVRVCAACNTVVVSESVPKLEHSYTDWSVVREAELFEIGEKKHTCERCGNVETKSYLSDQTMILIACAAAAVVVLLVIVKAANRRRRMNSVWRIHPSSYSSSNTRGASSTYDGGSNTSAGINNYSASNNYSGTSASGSDYDYFYQSEGTTTIDGETHEVHFHDAEGYSTGPYIEDAEGYKTPVDPSDVEPPFNWCDL